VIFCFTPQQPGNQHETPSTSSSPITAPYVPHTASGRELGGFLGFLQAYSSPLTRFTMQNKTVTTVTDAAISSTTPAATSDTNMSPAASLPKASTTSWKLPGGLGDIDVGTTFLNAANGKGVAKQLYPMSTVLVVALIAFLIGSLLRSLLSPADFIYVVTDLRDAEESNNMGGWREIRRLLEVKYVVGGWDFQVAVVRRH
jgi:hypothetical protein